MSSSFEIKKREITSFLTKCDDLIKSRSNVSNFDEIADKYLEEGEKREDEIDQMIANKELYTKDQQAIISKLKADIGRVLDQLESIDAPMSPSKVSQIPSSAHGGVISPPLNQPPIPAAANAPVAGNTDQPLPTPQLPIQSQGTAISPIQYHLTSLKHKSGNEIWKLIKASKTSNDLTFDSLKALGIFPNGFRPSFLQNVLSLTNNLYSYINFLAPKVTPHHLSFKDAAFGSGVGKILNHGSAEPRHLRIVTISGCYNMFLLNASNAGEIADRILRVCLIDGDRIISNIHTIRASGTSDPEKRNWIFDTATNDLSLGMQFGEIFLKCDSRSPTVSILFECGYVIRRVGSNDACIASCGWYIQPLVENNEPIRKGNFECLLYGGQPAEYNVGLGNGPPQPQPAQRPKKQASLKNSKEPFITFRISEFNLERELVDTVPDTLIGCTLHLAAFDFYCDSLISMLGKREHPQWAGRVNNPFLSTFPTVADQPDIMDVVRILWVEASKKLSRQERKDDQLVRTKFISTYLSLVIPALGSIVLGNKFDWLGTLANSHALEARRQELGAMLDVLKQNKSPFQLSNIQFKPVQSSEYWLDLQSPYCFSIVS